MNLIDGRMVAADRARIGDLELACRADGAGPQDEVTVRPEDIRVRGVKPGDENTFEATIGQIDFLGAFVRARLEAASLARRPLYADFSINLVRELTLAEGQRRPVTLPRARLRLYPPKRQHG